MKWLMAIFIVYMKSESLSKSFQDLYKKIIKKIIHSIQSKGENLNYRLKIHQFKSLYLPLH